MSGFNMRMAGGFAIDRLQEVVWSDEPFDSLILGQKQKELIHSLVKQHSARSGRFDDVVLGKGKGLVGLLSGNPGCGKTLTAEAVAEVLHQPLYIASAGELGTGPEQLDRRLGRILELTQTWNAVLLLDEAEVFLQRRDTTDVTRNALVSIFLRQLEYYKGVLIMTTNLITHCDPAFESKLLTTAAKYVVDI
jgi:SpoVK/Ycf46/Vps4 family AAA+-type ATPase